LESLLTALLQTSKLDLGGDSLRDSETEKRQKGERKGGRNGKGWKIKNGIERGWKRGNIPYR